jgi:hypothetical protein
MSLQRANSTGQKEEFKRFSKHPQLLYVQGVSEKNANGLILNISGPEFEKVSFEANFYSNIKFLFFKVKLGCHKKIPKLLDHFQKLIFGIQPHFNPTR